MTRRYSNIRKKKKEEKERQRKEILALLKGPARVRGFDYSFFFKGPFATRPLVYYRTRRMLGGYTTTIYSFRLILK